MFVFILITVSWISKSNRLAMMKFSVVVFFASLMKEKKRNAFPSKRSKSFSHAIKKEIFLKVDWWCMCLLFYAFFSFFFFIFKWNQVKYPSVVYFILHELKDASLNFIDFHWNMCLKCMECSSFISFTHT